MNKNIIPGLGVVVALLTGLLVLSIAKQMHVSRTTNTNSHQITSTVDANYSPVLPENFNGNVSTSLEVEDLGAVNVSVSVGQ